MQQSGYIGVAFILKNKYCNQFSRIAVKKYFSSEKNGAIIAGKDNLSKKTKGDNPVSGIAAMEDEECG